MTEQEIATEYLKGIQKHYLTKRFGLDFEKKLKKHMPEELYDFVEEGLSGKSDLTEDEKFELEAKLKNYVLETRFLNTEYESPALWYILSSLIENIKALFPTTNKFPYFGTVNSGDINAEAYSITGTDIKLILLEGELVTCGNLLCKIIAQSIPLKDDSRFTLSVLKSDLDKHLNNNEITERFNDFFFNATIRYPGKSKQYFLKTDLLEHLSSILLDSFENFIIGHEYGHIYFNHFEAAHLKKVSFAESNTDLSKINLNWTQEFEADNFGTQVIIALDKSGDKFPFSVLGPDILFTFLHYQNIFTINNSGDTRQESDTHPAPLDRKEMVREYIMSRYAEKDKEILRLTYQLIDDIFTHHTSNYKKMLAKHSESS